ncbi:MAG TPA: nucleoside hydrolase [Kribbellaceae bacterium]|nr:nucleoside hydrolase [Kribbellaceae bacterium]
MTDRPSDHTADWHAMVGFGESHDEFAELGEALTAGGPPPDGPSPLATAPLIIDTDLGGDPDDAFALAVAALTVAELALVITTDEAAGERARFARYLLDLLGRPEVPVVSGADLGNTRYFCVEGLAPAAVGTQPADVAAAVETVCTRPGPVRWLGIGPVSNLAAMLTNRPDLAERFVVTQMGGALRYRDPAKAEHNFRLDPAAASRLLHDVRRPTLVMSDVTFNPAMEITRDSPLYHKLAAQDAPDWARVVKEHFDRWADRFHPGSMQHDALALAAALLWPGIRFGRERVTLDDQARMRRDVNGVEVKVSLEADYGDFMNWLDARLVRQPAFRA